MASTNMPTLPGGIPNPFAPGGLFNLGGSASPPSTTAAPLTLADVIANLPDGWTIDQVVLHDSAGKMLVEKAPAPTTPLQPGMAIQIKGNGRTELTHVNGDASDIEPWASVSAEPKPTNPDVRNFGTTIKPDWRQYNPDSKNWESVPGVGTPAGTHLPSGVDQSNPYVQMAYRAAQDAGIDPNLFLAQINQESGFNPQARSSMGAVGIAQIMPGTASGWGVDPTDPQAALTAAAQHMAGYLKAYGGDWSRALAAYNAGPGVADQGPSAYPLETQNYIKTIMGAAGGSGVGGVGTTNRFQHVPIGGKEYLFDPTTGKYTDTGLGYNKPDVLERNGKSYQYDPKTDAWLPVKGLPDDTSGNKAMQAIQQQYDTITYIQQQLASGLMNPSDASAYLGAVKQQTAAALAGTTPFDIYKEDLTNRYQQAQVGRDILNNQMTASNTLTNDLLSQYDTGKMGLVNGNYNPIGLAQELTDQRSGNLGPQPTSDTAKALIDALNPSNPQPTIGTSTAAALGQPEPPLGTPLGAPLGAPGAPSAPPLQPGTGPADNTLREAA